MIEKKVTSAAAVGTVTAFVLYLLSTFVFSGAVPPEVSGLVSLIVTGVVTLVAGYMAPHTPREPE